MLIFALRMKVAEWVKKVRIRRIILALGLVSVWGVQASPVAGEWYARNIYPSVSSLLSRFSSLFPFSVGDCLIYGSILVFCLYPFYARWKKRRWLTIGGRMAESLLWIYVWFYLAWGLNYFREDFFTRTGILSAAYSADTFRTFLSAYTDSLNASFVPVETVDKSVVAEETVKGYREIAGRFGLVQPAGYLRSKPMLVPSLMSGVGVLGYMGPFFTEYNLNPKLLPVQYPFTYAHEMAHVLGISSEAEANLYGFLVCARSEVPSIRFSAYFALLPYVLSNAYGLLPEDEFNEWKATLSPEIKDLYNYKSAYWQALYSPLIGEIQSTAYNWFLKGNNIPSGRKNYSEVVALLMALEGDSMGR